MDNYSLEKILEKMTEKINKEESNDATASIIKKECKDIVSFLPTELCRTSLFFPTEKKELPKKRIVEKRVIIDTAWGRLIAIGPTLTVYDEDVLLAVLQVVKENLPKDAEHYRYTGKISAILKALNLKAGKENYDRIRDSLTMMSVMAFEFVKINPETGKRLSTTVMPMPIILKSTWDEEEKELDVIINPYFYNMYISKNITLINLKHRTEIKSQVGKALYRFLQSHKDEWRGKLNTLAIALNINPELPSFKIKERIKKAINELKKLKLISAKSTITKDNIVILKKLQKPLKNKASN